MVIKLNEVKVGIMVVFFLAGLIFITLRVSKDGSYQRGYRFSVEMKDVAGLELHAPVKLNGVDVGEVAKITIQYNANDTVLLLRLWVKEGVKVASDAKITVKTLGLMGEKYVSIQQSEVSSFIQPDAVIKGYDVPDLDDLMRQANVLSGQLSVLLGGVQGILVDNRESLRHIVTYLESASQNLDEFSLDVKKHPWKLLFKSGR